MCKRARIPTSQRYSYYQSFTNDIIEPVTCLMPNATNWPISWPTHWPTVSHFGCWIEGETLSPVRTTNKPPPNWTQTSEWMSKEWRKWSKYYVFPKKGLRQNITFYWTNGFRDPKFFSCVEFLLTNFSIDCTEVSDITGTWRLEVRWPRAMVEVLPEVMISRRDPLSNCIINVTCLIRENTLVYKHWVDCLTWI